MPNDTLQIAVSDLSADADDGIAARIHDPAWFLARQWQLGELRGDDAGSPAGVRLDVEIAPLSVWAAGKATTVSSAYDAKRQPLEALVEAEIWDTGSCRHHRLAVESGQRLARLLRLAGHGPAWDALMTGFAFALPGDVATFDAATQRYVRIMAGRVLDGAALLRELLPLRQGGSLTALPAEKTFQSIPAADRDGALAQLNRWLGEYAQRGAATTVTANPDGASPAWQSSRLEYSFGLGARLGAQTAALTAGEYFGGEADWYSLEGDAGASVAGGLPSTQSTFTFLPAPVQFRGMPSARFWELEDANVNLPKLDTVRTDPASKLFLEFALRFGNDWFVAPVPLPAGSVSRVLSLVATSTFGDHVVVRHTSVVDQGNTTWRMFALSMRGSAASAQTPAPYADLFVLPATSGQIADGPPVESVQCVRDEMANLAWAVETNVESAIAAPVDRSERFRRGQSASVVSTGSGLPSYRLGSAAPDYWIPLLPVAGSATTRMLERAAVPRFDKGVLVEVLQPQGRLLEPWRPLVLFDEEVPPEGSVVTRRYRFARASDGSPHLWVGRRKRTGKGEASSGLRFDTLESL